MRLPLLHPLVLIAVLAPQIANSQYPVNELMTVPAVASARGLAGTYWRTDLWVVNQSNDSLGITLAYACRSGCGPNPIPTFSVALQPNEVRLIEDVVNTAFASPETAGALHLYVPCFGCSAPFFATSRTYSAPSSESGTYGTAVPAFSQSQYTYKAMFLGLASNGGDLSSGFRTNAGVDAIRGCTVTYHLKDSSGRTLGAPISLPVWRPHQIDDIFLAVGAGGVITQNAVLEITTTAPAVPYVIVIDNRTGDSVFLSGSVASGP